VGKEVNNGVAIENPSAYLEQLRSRVVALKDSL